MSATDSFKYTLSDGNATSTATVDVMITGVSDAESTIVTIGDAPLRVSRSDPNSWERSWTDDAVEINHKSNFQDVTEPWSSASLNGRNSSVLEGGDLFGGDLGVSGQSLISSNIRQEIDGTEALRFDLGQVAISVTVDLSRLEGDLTNGSDAGRLQLLDDSGLVVDELMFSANATGNEKQITLDFDAGFTSVVLTAGANNDSNFVFGGLADVSGQYQSDPQNLGNGTWNGSDYLVDAIEFEFGEVQVVGAQTDSVA